MSTTHQNYYAQLWELDDEEIRTLNNAAAEAELGGEFDHIVKLKEKKFKKTIIRPDSKKWKE